MAQPPNVSQVSPTPSATDYLALVNVLQQNGRTLNAILNVLGTGVVVVPSVSGASQSQPSNPTAPASTSAYAMQGLAGSITPVRSGSVLMMISGTIKASTVTAGDGVEYQISYGTGAAPANAASVAGTQVGAVQAYENPTTITAADVQVPFSIQALVTGLTPSTAYWIDLAAKSLGTISSGSLSGISLTAIEL